METDLLKSLQILYVEDEPETRKQMNLFLRRKVAEVRVAANGAEGLEAFKKYRPHVVITDSRMPIMDGVDMSREIKKVSPRTPVIVVTAFQEEEVLSRSEKTDIDYYLMKPVDMSDLISTLNSIASKINNK